MVLPALMEAVAACARRRESVVVEGVHLSVEAALQLMHQHHPSCWVVPFLVYISNESKHLERFAVRARYMALTAAKNRYVHFFQNIRTIQADMGARADAARLPKIDNTNVDRSVAMIHDVTLAALREAAAGGSLVDRPGEAGELTAGPLLEKYEGCLLKWPWSSKRMIETLRERGALKGGGGKGAGEGPEGAGEREGGAAAAAGARDPPLAPTTPRGGRTPPPRRRPLGRAPTPSPRRARPWPRRRRTPRAATWWRRTAPGGGTRGGEAGGGLDSSGSSRAHASRGRETARAVSAALAAGERNGEERSTRRPGTRTSNGLLKILVWFGRSRAPRLDGGEIRDGGSRAAARLYELSRP